ncbi:hypothetical protein Efla_005880 [Eimeria flavescens]
MLRKTMVPASAAIPLQLAASHSHKLSSLRQHDDATVALSTAFVDAEHGVSKARSNFRILRSTASKRVVSAAALVPILAVLGLAYLCMRLLTNVVGGGAVSRKLSGRVEEERSHTGEHAESWTAECFHFPGQTLPAPSLNGYSAGEELGARPAKRARIGDVLLDQPFRAAHTQQPFQNTTPTFRGFVSTDYPQTSMYPYSMAGQLGEDVQLGFTQPLFFEGFAQSSYESRAGNGATEVVVPESFSGMHPGVEYGWVDGHGAGGEANNPDGGSLLSYGAALPDTSGKGGLLAGEEGLSEQPHSALSIMIPGAEERSPSSSGTSSTDAFGGENPLSEEEGRAEHPFTWLPPVLPGVVKRGIHPGGWYHPGLTIRFSTSVLLNLIRGIYAKPSLNQKDLNTLIQAVETLIYVKRVLSRPVSGPRTPAILANRFSGYFLVYEAIVSAAVLLQTDLSQSAWWKEFTDLHDTDAVFPAPTPAAQIAIPTMAFNVELVNRLSAALAILKTGVLPHRSEILDLKLMIFCHKYSPREFKGDRGNPWRDAEKQYSTRYGDSFHGCETGNTRKLCRIGRCLPMQLAEVSMSVKTVGLLNSGE